MSDVNRNSVSDWYMNGLFSVCYVVFLKMHVHSKWCLSSNFVAYENMNFLGLGEWNLLSRIAFIGGIIGGKWYASAGRADFWYSLVLADFTLVRTIGPVLKYIPVFMQFQSLSILTDLQNNGHWGSILQNCHHCLVDNLIWSISKDCLDNRPRKRRPKWCGSGEFPNFVNFDSFYS